MSLPGTDAPGASYGAPPATACLNCGAQLSGEYCADCGQKRPHSDLTLREFLRESTAELTNWDGKVPRTLKTLLVRPGRLTVDFLQGRRERWLRPLRVYLICSVAFFVTKPVVEAMTGRSTRDTVRVSRSGPSDTFTAEERRAIEEGLPARIFGKERMLRAVDNPKVLDNAFDRNFPKAMFVLLPFFALLTRIAWRKQMPRYPAHLYVALHVHAAWFAALTITEVSNGFFPERIALVVGLAILGYMTWYGVAASRVVFGESRARTLLKSVAVAVVYLMAFFLTTLALLAWVIFTV